jgi:alginate production protein
MEQMFQAAATAGTVALAVIMSLPTEVFAIEAETECAECVAIEALARASDTGSELRRIADADTLHNDSNPPAKADSETALPVGTDTVDQAGASDSTAKTSEEEPTNKRATVNPFKGKMLFQLPPLTQGDERLGRPLRPVAEFLKYQYSFGSESDVTYRPNPDLDNRIRDRFLLFAPQINGYLLYRPNGWVETLIEIILEREIAAHEEPVITLPNGETRVAEKRRGSLAVDQAFLTFKRLGQFELTVGRKNFEDQRHWLYDTSLDVALVRFKQGHFHLEASAGRKDMVDLDLLKPVQETRIDNYMLYLDYRGIEDIRLAGYAIQRDDRTGQEGRPLHLGLRALGAPSDSFAFWAELALLRGKDELQQNFKAHAVDFGGTYRFRNLPLTPAITLGYAFGSGDGDPNDNENTEFRQTGLHSNEMKMAGVSKFKYYGEVLDPDLSNLEIFTLGMGLRPAPTVFVDLVYHRYRLNEIADRIRKSPITALMNQDDTNLGKNVGSALDVVLGFRNLFGVRRLGLDLRAGWFFPGNIFRNEVGNDPKTPMFRGADTGVSALAKFWW